MNNFQPLFILLIALLGFTPLLAKEGHEQRIYLTRHAEKQPSPKDDPALTEQGEARAANIAERLVNQNISRIFSTDYLRTRSTAQPLADKLGVSIEIYSPSHPATMIQRLLSSNDNALIVGHSNTLNDLVQQLGGEIKTTINHDDYDNLYLLTLSDKNSLKTTVNTQLLKSHDTLSNKVHRQSNSVNAGNSLPPNDLSIEQIEQAIKKLPSFDDKIKYLNRLAPKINLLSDSEQARFYFLLGYQLGETGKLDNAIDYINKSIALLSPLPPSKTLVESYIERSYFNYIKTNDTNIYCPDREKALSLARKLNDKALLAKSLTQLAFCFNSGSQFHRGIELLEEAISIAKNHGLSVNLRAMIYNATGNLYRDNSLYERAYEYTLRAYDLWSSVNDVQDMFNMQHSLISSAIKLGQWNNAEQHVKKLFEMTQNNPDYNDFLFFAHLNAGRVAYHQNKFPLATFHLNSAINLKDTTNEQYFIDMTYGLLAISYMRQGLADEGMAAAQTFLSSSQGNQVTPLTLQNKAIVAFNQKDYSSAIETLMQAIEKEVGRIRSMVDNDIVYSSLDHNSKVEEFEKLLLENQLSINQLQLSKQNDQQKITHLTIIVIGLITVILVFLSLFLFQSRRYFIKRSRTDFLTGIANRGYTFEQAEQQFHLAKKRKNPLSVILFDIDHFKLVNDQYGHDVGDKAIISVAKQAQHCVKQHDILGRVGGEEFLIVLTNINVKSAKDVAERLRQRIEEKHFQFNGNKINLTISLGVACLNEKDMTFEQLVSRADQALYQAKAKGRNQTQIH